MARYEAFTPEGMTAHQHQVYDDIVNGPRGRIYGPFLVLMHNPGLASALQKSGVYVRWTSCLKDNLRELSIATIGRYWGAHVEWCVHSKMSIDAGVDPSIIDDLEANRRPTFSDPDEALVHELCATILEKARTDDDLHARALESLGDHGLIDLLATLTHYTTISLTLNSFEVAAPDHYKKPSFPHGRPARLKDRRGPQVNKLRSEGSDVQQRIAKQAAAAKGNRLGGSDRILGRMPELRRINQEISSYLRSSSLSARLRQLAVIVALRKFHGALAGSVQVCDALTEGIPPAVVDAIIAGETPTLTDPTDQVVYEVAETLIEYGALPDDLFGLAKDMLGFNALLDLVATIGYYAAVAMWGNVLEVDPTVSAGIPTAPAP